MPEQRNFKSNGIRVSVGEAIIGCFPWVDKPWVRRGAGLNLGHLTPAYAASSLGTFSPLKASSCGIMRWCFLHLHCDVKDYYGISVMILWYPTETSIQQISCSFWKRNYLLLCCGYSNACTTFSLFGIGKEQSPLCNIFIVIRS